MIVTTPEKWDVITRKGGDVSVAATVRLLIIDEVTTPLLSVAKSLLLFSPFVPPHIRLSLPFSLCLSMCLLMRLPTLREVISMDRSNVTFCLRNAPLTRLHTQAQALRQKMEGTGSEGCIVGAGVVLVILLGSGNRTCI